MTLTTYDEELCKKIEPNVSTTKERVEALKILRDAGIPTVVWLTPILPFINDTEENILEILNCCKEAKVFGIICFGMGLTLREGNREYYYSQLDEKEDICTMKRLLSVSWMAVRRLNGRMTSITLTKYEKGTIILLNEGEDTAHIQTYNVGL